jgi:hypothetical protein
MGESVNQKKKVLFYDFLSLFHHRPWDTMRKFDDELPQRKFDNVGSHFVFHGLLKTP